jgi:hypothetical protein
LSTLTTGLESSRELGTGGDDLNAAGVGDEASSAESELVPSGGLDRYIPASLALAAKEGPSSAALRFLLREALDEEESGLRMGELGCGALTVRAGDVVPSLVSIGLDSISSKVGRCSTLDDLPSRSTFGLKPPSLVSVSVMGASECSSDDNSDRSRNTGIFGLDVVPYTRKFGLDVPPCLATLFAKED